MTGCRTLSLTILLAVVSADPTLAQRKGKPPASTPAEAAFRCNQLQPPVAPDTPCGTTMWNGTQIGDGINGDGGAYVGIGTPEGGEGAHLNLNQEMWIGLREGRMQVRLDFSTTRLVSAPTCSPQNCRFNETRFPGRQMTLNGTYSELQTNVVDENDVEIVNGLEGLLVGQPAFARMKISFVDPLGADLLWGFNFHPQNNPGSELVQVYRVNACVWEIFAEEGSGHGARAALQAFGRIGGGARSRTDEGVFISPFHITLTKQNCTL